MAQGISPNPLNDISKAYLELVAKINKDEEGKVIEKWDDSSVNKVDPDLVLKVESKRTPATVVNTESYSDWRNDLSEIVAEPESEAEKEVKEKKGIKNKVVINPKLGEAVAEIGGQILEIKEIDRQVVDPAERKEDPSIKSKENRQKMLKKQVLLRKLQAVRQGAGADITASYEPDGEMVEGVKSEWKKGMKRHKKAVEDKKVKERKAVPYAALAAEYDPLEDAIEYFYEEGINEEGFDQFIEEIGLEEFVDFVEGGVVELTEERAARKASVRAKKYDVVKKEVDKADAARKKAKKGEYAPSYAKKETDVTVYDDKPTAKKKAPAKKTVVKKAAPKPVAKKPVTKKVVKAVAKVKKTQPKKKATKQGLGDKIRTAYKAGVKRHRKATQGARVFGKGFAAGAKKAVKFAKDVKKVVSEEEKVKGEKNCGCGQNPCVTYGKKKKGHDCASKVKHEEYGIGNCIKEMHTLDEDGHVTHYDVMFSNKIIKNVPAFSLEILEGMYHEHYVNEEKNKENFTPHKMIDPSTKKVYMANTYDEHKKYKEKGYVHEAVKGQDTEMRRAASAERRSGETKRLSPSKGRANVGKMARDIRFYDKKTKATKPSVLGMVTDEVVLEKDLNAAERRALPNKDFVFAGKGEGPEGKQRGAYPIPDKKHARNALAMAAAHASPEKEAKVKAAVKKKFPDIQQEAIDRQAKDRKKLSQPHSVSGSRRDHSHDVDSALTDHVPRKGKGRMRPASKKEMRVAAMREDKLSNWRDELSELNRYEKETGKSSGRVSGRSDINTPRKGTPTKTKETPTAVSVVKSKTIRPMTGRPQGQKKSDYAARHKEQDRLETPARTMQRKRYDPRDEVEKATQGRYSKNQRYD